MKFATTFILIFSAFLSFSQEKNNFVKKTEQDPNSLSNKEFFKQRRDELLGTYQFRVTKDDFHVIITPEIITMVEENRMPESDYQVFISENVYLFVPSFQTIEDPNFEPLPLIEYVSEDAINVSE